LIAVGLEGLVRTQGDEMIRKLLLAAGLAAAGWLAFSQRQDVIRYLKIRQMSAGDGHPENVPAGGSRRYTAPAQGTPDGTNNSGSAARGGPAQA
jgi:hypothetical protein